MLYQSIYLPHIESIPAKSAQIQLQELKSSSSREWRRTAWELVMASRMFIQYCSTVILIAELLAGSRESVESRPGAGGRGLMAHRRVAPSDGRYAWHNRLPHWSGVRPASGLHAVDARDNARRES